MGQATHGEVIAYQVLPGMVVWQLHYAAGDPCWEFDVAAIEENVEFLEN